MSIPRSEVHGVQSYEENINQAKDNLVRCTYDRDELDLYILLLVLLLIYAGFLI